MNSDAILFYQNVPKMLWGLMNSFAIPGLGFTPGALIMGVISFKIIIWVVGNIFTFGSQLMSSPGDSSGPRPGERYSNRVIEAQRKRGWL